MHLLIKLWKQSKKYKIHKAKEPRLYQELVRADAETNTEEKTPLYTQAGMGSGREHSWVTKHG